MGQATRTTKLLLDLGKRTRGGANAGKRAHLEATAAILDAARSFFVDFFLAHQDKLSERVSYFSERQREQRERLIRADELLTWAESVTVATKEQAYTQAIVSVEVNPHGTSQYCSRCGAKGERFSLRAGRRVKHKGGKLFWCPICHYEVQADFNASVNVHHSFYQELHWQPRLKRSG